MGLQHEDSLVSIYCYLPTHWSIYTVICPLTGHYASFSAHLLVVMLSYLPTHWSVCSIIRPIPFSSCTGRRCGPATRRLTGQYILLPAHSLVSIFCFLPTHWLYTPLSIHSLVNMLPYLPTHWSIDSLFCPLTGQYTLFSHLAYAVTTKMH